jgi:hypothetical protein
MAGVSGATSCGLKADVKADFDFFVAPKWRPFPLAVL